MKYNIITVILIAVVSLATISCLNKASNIANAEQHNPYKFETVRVNSSIYRIENKETICYVSTSAGGMDCKFK